MGQRAPGGIKIVCTNGQPKYAPPWYELPKRRQKYHFRLFEPGDNRLGFTWNMDFLFANRRTELCKKLTFRGQVFTGDSNPNQRLGAIAMGEVCGLIGE